MSRVTLQESLIFARILLRLQGIDRPPADAVVRRTFPEAERDLWEQLDEEERDAISAVYDYSEEDLTEEIDREAPLGVLPSAPPPPGAAEEH